MTEGGGCMVEHQVLKQYMMKFSTEELKSFLGVDLVESLLEWNIDNEGFASKKRLAEMIICVHGLRILGNKEFRIRLLKSFTKNQIFGFRTYLPKEYLSCDDPRILIDKISNIRWKENPVNEHFVKILGYSIDDIFEKKKQQSVSQEKITANDKFYELLDYQYIIRQQALNVLSSNCKLSRFMIHMPTGTGKTKTATHIICHHYNYNLKKKGMILWVAHTTELLEQAYETFCNVWRNIGNGSIYTYKLWGDNEINIPEDGFNGFMVCGIQKLMSLQNGNKTLFDAIVRDTRLLVYDEAHKASAPETREIIERIMTCVGGLENRALMGLSATPGRTAIQSFDNDLLVSTFGNRIISIDTKLMNSVNLSAQEAANTETEDDIIKYFQNRGVLSKIIKNELKYQVDFTDEEIKNIRVDANSHGYDDLTNKALEIIGKNKNRNLKILQKLSELNAQKKPTIVFACSVKHAKLLSAMLTLKNIPNAAVYGEMASNERKSVISRFKDTNDEMNILINYEVLTTGFDATNIECVFIARPTKSIVLYSQMIGRGLRGPQMGGNETCLLIDIKDNLSVFDENTTFSHFNKYWGM